MKENSFFLILIPGLQIEPKGLKLIKKNKNEGEKKPKTHLTIT